MSADFIASTTAMTQEEWETLNKMKARKKAMKVQSIYERQSVSSMATTQSQIAKAVSCKQSIAVTDFGYHCASFVNLVPEASNIHSAG